MRVVLTWIAMFPLVGCHSATGGPSDPLAVKTESPGREYRDGASAALVFSPPVSADLPDLDLARDARTASAFLGYDEVVVSSYYLHIDDRQDDLWGDRHQRRAIISEARTRYR